MDHFVKTSARVKGLEEQVTEVQGQLDAAQDRIRELEASNAERFRKCAQVHELSDQRRRSLDRAERRLEEALREASSWRHATEKARRR